MWQQGPQKLQHFDMRCNVSRNPWLGHGLQIGDAHTCVGIRGPRELQFRGCWDSGSASGMSEREVCASSHSVDLRSLVPWVPGTDQTLLHQSQHTTISLSGLTLSSPLFLLPWVTLLASLLIKRARYMETRPVIRTPESLTTMDILILLEQVLWC